MSDRIKIVQGDTRPLVYVSLTDDSTLLPIDISSASVVMKFRQLGTTLLLDTLVGTLIAGKVRTDGTIDTTNTTPGAGGRAVFAWNAGTLNNPPGYYEGEIEITFGDGTHQTLYDTLQFQLRAEF